MWFLMYLLSRLINEICDYWLDLLTFSVSFGMLVHQNCAFLPVLCQAKLPQHFSIWKGLHVMCISIEKSRSCTKIVCASDASMWLATRSSAQSGRKCIEKTVAVCEGWFLITRIWLSWPLALSSSSIILFLSGKKTSQKKAFNNLNYLLISKVNSWGKKVRPNGAVWFDLLTTYTIWIFSFSRIVLSFPLTALWRVWTHNYSAPVIDGFMAQSLVEHCISNVEALNFLSSVVNTTAIIISLFNNHTGSFLL